MNPPTGEFTGESPVFLTRIGCAMRSMPCYACLAALPIGLPGLFDDGPRSCFPREVGSVSEIIAGSASTLIEVVMIDVVRPVGTDLNSVFTTFETEQRRMWHDAQFGTQKTRLDRHRPTRFTCRATR